MVDVYVPAACEPGIVTSMVGVNVHVSTRTTEVSAETKDLASEISPVPENIATVLFTVTPAVQPEDPTAVRVASLSPDISNCWYGK